MPTCRRSLATVRQKVARLSTSNYAPLLRGGPFAVFTHTGALRAHRRTSETSAVVVYQDCGACVGDVFS